MEKDKGSCLRSRANDDEQRAPDASRTGALGLKGRMSMRSGSLGSGESMTDDRMRSAKYELGMTKGWDRPREAINKSLCPAPFLALPRATNALAISSFDRSGVLK